MTFGNTPDTWNRLWAYLIDRILILFFYFPVFFTLFLANNFEFFLSIYLLIYIYIVPAVYEFVCLSLFSRTFGHWLFGFKVVNFNNWEKEISSAQALLRSVAGRLTLFFSYAPYLTLFYRYDRTHWIDWIAETRLIQAKPRKIRPKVRWVLGTVLILYTGWGGMVRASYLLNQIDWEEKRIEMKAFFEIDKDLDQIFEDLEE